MTTAPKPMKKTPSVVRLEEVLPVLRERFGVEKIGVFGSTARGEERSDSDVDVLVELSPGHLTFRNFMALADFLEELYGRRVDLVTVGGLDPLIRQDVESEVVWCEA
ncbi:nucleotidyltransferase family protein [Methanoculleus sp.]|uniref:nucleotidyltransferase family protein n=1 Tax=Methanoculleus sp. TaxID=90427 RepID=UPI0025FF582C|nr:nucleotidyltransferase family protein [Methanoculleus sp.]